MRKIQIGGRAVEPVPFTLGEILKYAELYEITKSACAPENLFRVLRGVSELVFAAVKRADSSVTVDEIMAMGPDELTAAVVAIVESMPPMNLPAPPDPRVN